MASQLSPRLLIGQRLGKFYAVANHAKSSRPSVTAVMHFLNPPWVGAECRHQIKSTACTRRARAEECEHQPQLLIEFRVASSQFCDRRYVTRLANKDVVAVVLFNVLEASARCRRRVTRAS